MIEAHQQIFLLRHGPVAAETDRCWGWTDLPLHPNADFEKALDNLQLPRGSEVISSDLARARETALRLARKGRGITFRSAEPDLRELHFGLWEGLRWQEIEERYPDAYAHYMKHWRTAQTPEGESWLDLKTRCANWLRRNPPCERTLVIVAHQGSLRALWALIHQAYDPGTLPPDEEELDRQAMNQRWAYGEAIAIQRRRS